MTSRPALSSENQSIPESAVRVAGRPKKGRKCDKLDTDNIVEKSWKANFMIFEAKLSDFVDVAASLGGALLSVDLAALRI